ncbi:hypothetical protein [Microbacterium sp. SCN 69-37]|uniref:hypothetical protein n=1 Tax=Microbacterium sp. SCN 69-37 TaxID=1660115 RepID=UPI0025EDCF53|nr:hypothetical protein [Microbacterium sp. SCN 69-37]
MRSQFAGFFAETGREDDAIRLVQEMIDGGFSCGEEPEHALARTLLPSLRAGMLDQARAAHLRSYRLAKDNPANLAIIADNVVFCAVTGNEARALALVEKHLPWLVHDGLDAAAHETALASFAVGLDAVAAAGHPDTPVRGSDAEELVTLFGSHEGAWTASALASRAWALADTIAAAFDVRNGTDAHRLALALPRVQHELDALGDGHPLERADLLSTLAIGRMWAGAHADAVERARAAAALFAGAGDTRRAHGMRLLEADALSADEDPTGASGLLDTLLGDPDLEDRRRVRVLATRARLHGVAEAFAAGAAAADEAARVAVSIGVDDAMVSEMFLLAAMLHEDDGQPAGAVSRYRVAAERRDAVGLPSVDVRFRQGRAMLAAGYAAEAVDTLNDVLREASESGVEPGSRALTAVLLAQALHAAEEYGNAVGAWAYAAVGLVRGNEDEVGLLADGLHVLAQAHQQRGDEEAVTLIDEALELGRRHEATWFVADVLDTRARLLVGQGRTDAAVATALQAADTFADAGDPASAGASELLAARVLREAERADDAVALYRAAFEHASDADPLRQAVALELGDLLEALGRHGEAADVRTVLPA